MDYELFAELHLQATEEKDLDMYIGERGWQEWMDNFPPASLGTILKNIFDLAHGDLKSNRERIGLNQKQFSGKYNIPVTTVGKWEREERELSPWLKVLIDYSIFGSMENFYSTTKVEE
ncbi:helix-turn-helix domain-containing protein [Enterococcus nangangensis]|uniref:helix-turn-helix domain-containing protein n=1 Tax=Enterococcus nangangensis TaxID=2559926 RepID=UPI0010F86420|nr:helix-turn-helix domain-containing protein [Enterococcus nangangensis]